MEQRSFVDGRLTKFGRVTPIQVEGSEDVLKEREHRAKILGKSPPEFEDGRVVKPGFKDVACEKERLLSAYVLDVKKNILSEAGLVESWQVDRSMVFDLLDSTGKGWVIIQEGSTRTAVERLETYLLTLGVDPKGVLAVPLTIPDAVLKTLSESSEGTFMGFRGGKNTDISMSTRLPGLAHEKHYHAVTHSGIHNEPWRSSQVRAPYLAGSGLDPPVVTFHPNGFTIGTDYQSNGTWAYVDWAIRTVETMAGVPVTRKAKNRSLAEFEQDNKESKAKLGSESKP